MAALEIYLGGNHASSVYNVRGTYFTIYATPAPSYAGGIFEYSDELGEIGTLRLYDDAAEFEQAVQRLKVAAVVARLHGQLEPFAPFLPRFDETPDNRYSEDCYICDALGIPACSEVWGVVPDRDADPLYPIIFAPSVRVEYDPSYSGGDYVGVGKRVLVDAAIYRPPRVES